MVAPQLRNVIMTLVALSICQNTFADAAYMPSTMPRPTDTRAYAPPNSMLMHVRAHQDNHPYAFFFTTGAEVQRLNNGVNVYLGGGVTNQYNANVQSQWGGLFGIGFGVTKHPFDYLSITIDPAIYTNSSSTIQGSEITNSDPPPNLTYQFNVHTFALMMESHFVYTTSIWQEFSIVGVVGAGVALNKLYNYSEVIIPGQPGAAAAPFTDNSTGNFAYEVGLGLEHPLFVDKKHKVTYNGSLEYRYFYFGSGALGTSSNELSGGGHLQVSPIDMHAIILSLNVGLG